MKLPLLVCVALLNAVAVCAEPAPVSQDVLAQRTHNANPGMTRYSLNFPGGTSQELAAAIAKASGKPCNLVVAPKFAEMKLPALRLENITTSELFAALRESSHESEWNSQGQVVGTIKYNFTTMNDPATDESIWVLFAGGMMPDTKKEQPAFCHVYSVAKYLNEYSIDDITTALTTAWNLQGAEPPKLAFHKETTLLIVVGDRTQHESVHQVLDALTSNAEGKHSSKRARAAATSEQMINTPPSK